MCIVGFALAQHSGGGSTKVHPYPGPLPPVQGVRTRRISVRMNKKQILRFGLPKGSLQDATIEKMAKAGWNISVSSRSYIPYVDDAELEIRMIRAQEISRYVEHGYLDCGITGLDWIHENNSKVH